MARLVGAAHCIRQRMGAVRFKVWDAGYEASVAALRDAGPGVDQDDPSAPARVVDAIYPPPLPG